MFPKIRNILFLVLSSIIFLNSCIEQAIRYNNEPENSTVFVASTDKNIYALDAITGAKLWSIEVNSPIIQGPIVTDSMMYVGCTDQKMYAYNYLKKALRWSVSVGNMASLTLGNNVIHARNTDKTFRTFNLEDGRKLWETSMYGGVDSIPVIASDVVIIRTTNDILKAFNAQSGNEQWSKKTFLNNKANPLSAGGTTFYTSDSLYAIDNATGRKKWSYFVGGITNNGRSAYVSQTNALLLSKNLLFIADQTNKNLTAIKADSAIFKGSFSPITDITGLGTINSVVYAYTKGGGLTAIDTSLRSEVWRLNADINLQTPPNIISGIIFAGTYNRTFYAIDGKTGAKKWAFETGDISPARSTFSNDIVFISSQDGNVHALDAETGTKKWSFKTNGKIYSRPVVLTVDKKIL